MKTQAQVTKTTAAVQVGQTVYGTPVPRIEFKFAKGLHFRAEKALLLRTAAVVEEAAMKENAQFVVEISDTTVYLELVTGDAVETKRAKILLEKVLAGLAF